MSSKKQICTTPLRIPSDLKEWAKEQAKGKKCSLNAWLITLLTEIRRRQDTGR